MTEPRTRAQKLHTLFPWLVHWHIEDERLGEEVGGIRMATINRSPAMKRRTTVEPISSLLRLASLPTRNTNHPNARPTSTPRIPGMGMALACNRRTQGRCSPRGRVSRLTLNSSEMRRLDHVRRRGKVGFSGAESDHIHALGPKTRRTFGDLNDFRKLYPVEPLGPVAQFSRDLVSGRTGP